MPRLTVEFTDEAYKLLEKIAEEMGNSKKEAIKRAISLLGLAIEEQKNGSVLEFANEKKNYRREIAFL